MNARARFVRRSSSTIASDFRTSSTPRCSSASSGTSTKVSSWWGITRESEPGCGWTRARRPSFCCFSSRIPPLRARAGNQRLPADRPVRRHRLSRDARPGGRGRVAWRDLRPRGRGDEPAASVPGYLQGALADMPEPDCASRLRRAIRSARNYGPTPLESADEQVPNAIGGAGHRSSLQSRRARR
jgi:hypothetical protein